LLHWHKLIEDFQTAPKHFYTTVELALDHVPPRSQTEWSLRLSSLFRQQLALNN